MHTQAQQRQTQIVDRCVAPNRLPWARHRQHLPLISTGVPPKRPQNQHIQWPASDNNREALAYREGQGYQLASHAAYPKGDLGTEKTLLKQILLYVVST